MPDSMTSTSGAIAGAILREAVDIVEGERNVTHGSKERSFAAIAELWNAYLRSVHGEPIQPLMPEDVAWFMVLLKIARTHHGTAIRDHFTDAAGYAAIAGEIALGRR